MSKDYEPTLPIEVKKFEDVNGGLHRTYQGAIEANILDDVEKAVYSLTHFDKLEGAQMVMEFIRRNAGLVQRVIGREMQESSKVNWDEVFGQTPGIKNIIAIRNA